jgi:hypothetical protein
MKFCFYTIKKMKTAKKDALPSIFPLAPRISPSIPKQETPQNKKTKRMAGWLEINEKLLVFQEKGEEARNYILASSKSI